MNKEEKERFINIRNDLISQVNKQQKLPDGIINRDDPDDLFNITCPPDLTYLCLSKSDYDFIKPFIQGIRVKREVEFASTRITTDYYIFHDTITTDEKVYIVESEQIMTALKILIDNEFMIFKRSYKSYLGG